MDGGAGRVVVVTDANVLINLLQARRLELLGSIDGHAFVVTPEAIEEVTDPAQARALAEALERGVLRTEPLIGTEELDSYLSLRTRLGSGEAASLALAIARGWSVASDKRRVFRRLAVQKIGEDRLMDTSAL